MNGEPLRIGTRSSRLALWQAQWVAGELKRSGQAVEIVHVSTTGDVTSGPLGEIGGQGLFTKEIQAALLDSRVDIAVHSLKDLPTEPTSGLTLAAVPVREACGDVLVSRGGFHVDTLPKESIVGTGSVRRRAQLLHARPDLDIRDIRGNVETRLRKMDEGEYDAVVLAEAGLRRLDLAERIVHVIDKRIMLPAVGQGALGIEVRATDQRAKMAVGVLHHPDSYHCVEAERVLLAELRGGCLAPVGAWARIEVERDLLHLDGIVVSGDGIQKISAHACGPPSKASDIGRQVASQLMIQGAQRIISYARNTGGRG
ncbi:hydroxymethylbilane synthase [bacterium]|nr:hydroxymethylbilane synthase [bacterium]